MRILLTVGLAILVCVSVAHAQQESPLQQQLDAVFAGCVDKPDATHFKTHVETILCVNDGMTVHVRRTTARTL